MRRRFQLVTNQCYHVFNKSIAGFRIFLNHHEYSRMLKTLSYYQRERVLIPFSEFLSLTDLPNPRRDQSRGLCGDETEKLVDIIAYCLMPTHFHLILRQKKDRGISAFTGRVLNSYTRYFNIKHQRKGPLWQGPFKNVLIDSDRQLCHLTRYLHLNPVAASLVKWPEQWRYSSYREYLNQKSELQMCHTEDVLNITLMDYRTFVNGHIGYQKELRAAQRIQATPGVGKPYRQKFCFNPLFYI